MISKLPMAQTDMYSVENVPEILVFSQSGNIPNIFGNSIGS